MSRVIFTEEERQEIIQKYGLTDEQYQQMSNVPKDLLSNANRMSPFLIKENKDIIDNYLDFLTWTTSLQPSIEGIFGISCTSTESSESDLQVIGHSQTAKCILIWRLIVKVLTFYITSKYSPLTDDKDGKHFMPVINVIESNKEMDFIAKQIFNGNSSIGKIYTLKSESNVYVSPIDFENSVISIYKQQRNLFQ
jgi:hypothetical protein